LKIKINRQAKSIFVPSKREAGTYIFYCTRRDYLGYYFF